MIKLNIITAAELLSLDYDVLYNWSCRRLSAAEFDHLIDRIHMLGFELANEKPTLLQMKRVFAERKIVLVGDRPELS